MDSRRLYKSELRIILFTLTITVAILCTLPYQMSFAAVINCLPAAVCRGTSADDIIFASYPSGSFIEGLAGNDYIIGTGTNPNYIYGGDGNDILVGSVGNDVLYGGRGNDKYDAGLGDDTIFDEPYVEGSLVSNDDLISGGYGNDWIVSGEGIDRINGGPGNDQVYPNAYTIRDFSTDSVDCGSGIDYVYHFYSGDMETAAYCENLSNNDG